MILAYVTGTYIFFKKKIIVSFLFIQQIKEKIQSNSIAFFYFEKRNANLENMGYKTPKATKTGTTIAGIIFKV